MAAVETYARTHDRLLRRYRRYALYIVWAAVLNIVALVITALSVANGEDSSFGYGALFNYVGLAMIAIEEAWHPGLALYILYSFLISIPGTGLLMWWGLQSYRGNKKSLYFSAVFYGADTLLTVLTFWSYLAIDSVLAILVHLIIMTLMLAAIYKRYQLVELQNRHLGPPLKKTDESVPTTVLSFNETKRPTEKSTTVGDKLTDTDSPEPPSD